MTSTNRINFIALLTSYLGASIGYSTGMMAVLVIVFASEQHMWLLAAALIGLAINLGAIIALNQRLVEQVRDEHQ